MATFRKRGTTWQVVVRRKGLPPLSKSFPTKADASLWARQLEHQADTGCLRDDPRILAQLTLGDLLRRYKDEITPRKRGRDPETAVSAYHPEKGVFSPISFNHLYSNLPLRFPLGTRVAA